MPEYNDFAPVDAQDLVNLVSGDFSYTVPVMTVPGPGLGFPLVLGYHAGVLQKQEATWVGLGWDLQAGAITRQVNQTPDDFKGDSISENFRTSSIHGWLGSISYYGVTIGLSWDNIHGGGGMVGYTLSYGIGKNTGIGASIGIQAGVNGVYDGVSASVGIGITSKGEGSSGLGVGGSLSIGYKPESGISAGAGAGLSFSGERDKNSHEMTSASLGSVGVSLSSEGGLNGSANLGLSMSQQMSVQGQAHDESFGITIPFYFYGYGELNWGTYSYWIEGHQNNKYFGFLYEDKQGMNCSGNSGAGVNCSDSDSKHLADKKMEFNGFKAAYPYPIPENTKSKPLIFPKLMASTPDIYSVATQGLSGVFEPHRKEDGDYVNNLVTNRENGSDAECDVPIFAFLTSCTRHVDYNRTFVLESNKNLHNQGKRGDDVYWRFTDDFGGAEYTNPNLRDSSAEASVQSRNIKPYFYKDGKISGFEITKEDGAKYIYSFVLHNVKEMKMAHEDGSAVDISTDQTTPSYAYAWLLTAIESPDYVDVTHIPGSCEGAITPCLPGAGDMGGWVRFYYGLGNSAGNDSGLNQTAIYNWRTPYVATANSPGKYLPNPYLAGLDNGGTNDDGYNWKISQTASEGIKEVAYLMKVETPTHIARFHTSDRLDGKQSALTDLQPNPLKIIEDFDNNRVLFTKDGLIQGAPYIVQLRYKVQILRDKGESGCVPDPYSSLAYLPNVTRNPFNGGSDIVMPADSLFIDRSGMRANGSFACLNVSGINRCQNTYFIDEFSNQVESDTLTAEPCTLDDVNTVCLEAMTGKVEFPGAYTYSGTASNDPLATPNAFPNSTINSVHDFYTNYCVDATKHITRYYGERRIYQAALKYDLPVTHLEKLDSITLVNKLDTTREIAAVQFKYDYSLVPGTPNSDAPGYGKLTLRSVRMGASSSGPWLPAYKFDYQSYNPSFQATNANLGYETQEGWDRWGYHCSICKYNSHEPDGTAAAWNLEQITMPSGGRIHVDYEAKNYHTTLALDSTRDQPFFKPVSLTDAAGSGNFIQGKSASHSMTLTYPPLPADYFRFPHNNEFNSGVDKNIKRSMDDIRVYATERGRVIDHYSLKLRFQNLTVPPEIPGSHVPAQGYIAITHLGMNSALYRKHFGPNSPPVISLIPIQSSNLKSTTGDSCSMEFSGPWTCDYEADITVSASDYEAISDSGFQFSVFSYADTCVSRCASVGFCPACSDGGLDLDDPEYLAMVPWVFFAENPTETKLDYSIDSWLKTTDKRIGGGVRVAKLTTTEPFSGKANSVQYSYGEGVTPTFPPTFGTFDDVTLDGKPFFPRNVGYENFVGNPGVTYSKVSTVFTPATGAPYRTDYHFITAKDLPTQFSASPQVEIRDSIQGSLDWHHMDGGTFLDSNVSSTHDYINLDPLKVMANNEGAEVRDYEIHFKFSNLGNTWYQSASSTVTDQVNLNCDNFSQGGTDPFPYHFLMFEGYGHRVEHLDPNYTYLPTILNQRLPVYPIRPALVSRGTGSNYTCPNFLTQESWGAAPPYTWPYDQVNFKALVFGDNYQSVMDSVAVENGEIVLKLSAATLEAYRATHQSSELRLEPRLVWKFDANHAGVGYGVQDYHLDWSVTAICSPVQTARNFYRVNIQDYSALWGNLWKKEDFAAGATEPIRVNLVKWRFNDRWMKLIDSQTVFDSVRQNGKLVWSRSLGGADSTRVLESYLKNDTVPFVKAESEAIKPYFGMAQTLDAYRYFGNGCDADIESSDKCGQENIIVTQTAHQRFLPQVAENTVLQDGLAKTTYSTYYDFVTGLPLKTRTINSDGAVSDVYTQPAHFQYPDMAAANQFTQPFSSTHYFYPSSAPDLTADPIAANAVAATYTRWRPFNAGGDKSPYRKAEDLSWRNRAAAGQAPVAFSLPNDHCPLGALPDQFAGAPAEEYCTDSTQNPSAWISGGRNSLYDAFGHVLEFIRPNGSKVAGLYAYQSRLQNAVAMRAGADEVFHESFEVASETEAHLFGSGPQAPHAVTLRFAKTGDQGFIVGNVPGEENAVCFAAPPLHDNKSYVASVWYFDATSGASLSDPDATRPGILLGESNGCSATFFPQDPGVDPNNPARATGSKTWKHLQVSFNCGSAGYDPSQLKVCLYASRGNTGSSVAYDELRIRPAEAQMSTFTYDLYGNMTSSADPNETVTHYEYDPFGNLTGIRNDDGLLLGSKAQQYGRVGK